MYLYTSRYNTREGAKRRKKWGEKQRQIKEDKKKAREDAIAKAIMQKKWRKIRREARLKLRSVKRKGKEESNGRI